MTVGELVAEIIDRLGDEVPMIRGRVDLHPIVMTTVKVLAEAGIVELEDAEVDS